MKPLTSVTPIVLAALFASFIIGCGDDENTGTPSTDVTADSNSADTSQTDTLGDTSTADVVADVADAESDAVAPDASVVDGSPDDASTDTGADAAAPECTQPCDCEQGEGCVNGVCSLGAEPVFCCDKEGCADGSACTNNDGTSGLCGVDTSPLYGALVFNEVLIDGAVDGDPNGDGDFPDSVGDEFCELVNTGDSDIDLSGFTLVENTLPNPRHTFSEGTTLGSGHAMVVFGGGTAPDDTATAQFVTANANEGAIPFGLHLDNEGDTLRLLDKDGALVASFSYGVGEALSPVTDESITRSPDVTGDWVAHSSVSESLFSPGTRLDGTSF